MTITRVEKEFNEMDAESGSLWPRARFYKGIFSLLKTPHEVIWMHNFGIVLSGKSSEFNV